jgi:hypothetical protein
MRFPHALWLFPLFLSIHNGEEAIWMPQFWQRRLWNVPLSQSQLWLMMIVLDALAVLVTYFAVKCGKQSWAAYLYAGFVFVILLNVFWHVAVAIWYRAYAPGVVTAVVFNFPSTIYLLRKALLEHYIFNLATRP